MPTRKKTRESFTFSFEHTTYVINQPYDGRPTRIYLQDGRVLVITRWEIALPMRAIPDRIEHYDQPPSLEELAAHNNGLVAHLQSVASEATIPATTTQPASSPFLPIDLDDLPCRRCPEVYEAYAVQHEGLFTKEERARFFQGDGCPACGFGTKTERLLSEDEQAHRYDVLLEHWYAASQ